MDIRKAILDQLERSGRSKYWLAEGAHNAKPRIAHKETVYRYLRGDIDTTGEVIGGLLDMLEMPLGEGPAERAAKPAKKTARKKGKSAG